MKKSKTLFRLPEGKMTAELAGEYPEYFSVSEGRTLVTEKWEYPGFAISSRGGEISIKYAFISDMLRALGSLLSMSSEGIPGHFNIRKIPPLEFRGLMIDVSRNGVLKPDYLKKVIRILSLMGLNKLALYTEDTYEVAGHPLIGYCRGSYSKAELRSVSRYAKLFGIEMFPCIQTLGHMEQVLKYRAYDNVRDTYGILSVDSKDTPAFVETLIRNASEPYESGLIHLGMDETKDLGRGKCFHINRKIDPRAMYLKHMINVNKICRRLGLQPIIWGDIVLGLSYGVTAMSKGQMKNIPGNMIMNYWNYDDEDQKVYENTINTYRRMGFEPLVSPGIWNWNRLWGFYPKAENTLVPFMKAAKKAGIKRSMMTMWGDDGQEAPFASSFPGLALYFEHCYENSANRENVKKTVKAICKDSWEHLTLPAKMDAFDRKGIRKAANMAKCFLYDDPLIGAYSSHAGKRSFNAYYEKLKIQMRIPAENSSPANKDLFRYAYALADCLSAKADLRNNAYRAYHSGNRRELNNMLISIPGISEKLDALWKAHRKIWFNENKVFGLEIIDSRYGICFSRLEAMKKRLSGYLEGRMESIEEFEEKPRNIFGEFPGIRITHREIAFIPASNW